jgi:hypothetical protein
MTFVETTHVYREANRRLVVNTEMQTGDLDFIIYRSSIGGWQSPHDKDPISQDKKMEILGKMERYMQVNGLRYKVQ